LGVFKETGRAGWYMAHRPMAVKKWQGRECRARIWAIELPSLQAPAAISFYDSMLLMTLYDVGVQQCNSPRLAS
jgi:hypothetical protein